MPLVIIQIQQKKRYFSISSCLRSACAFRPSSPYWYPVLGSPDHGICARLRIQQRLTKASIHQKVFPIYSHPLFSFHPCSLAILPSTASFSTFSSFEISSEFVLMSSLSLSYPASPWQIILALWWTSSHLSIVKSPSLSTTSRSPCDENART